MTGQAEPFGPFLERWAWPSGEVQVLFHCRGCGGTHAYWLAHPEGSKGPIWEFNGNAESPSFTPSLRVRTGNGHQCHLYVTDGQIRYCGDCTHDLAGKTVPMEAYP